MKPQITLTETTSGTRRTYTATCSACGWSYSNLVRSDVEIHKRWHRPLCPALEGDQ